MGLKEKKESQNFQDNVYPGLLEKITAAAKFSPEIEVKWETLAEDGKSHLYNECWTDIYFKPIINAFEAICADDMGADAVKEGVKKIVIHNEGNTSAQKWVSFDGGVITLNHAPASNAHDIDGRTKYLQSAIEDGL